MSSRPIAVSAFIGAVLAASLAGGNACAADERTDARAVDLFDEGKALEDKGDYPAACAKFQESADLDIRVGTFARLAQCEEKVGHMVSARTHWARARDVAEGTQDPRAEHAAREFERVDALVPKLNLVLAGPVPAGLSLVLDVDPVGAGVLGVPLPVTVGAHFVRATAPGKRDFEATVQVRDDGAVTQVRIDLSDAPSLAPAEGAEGTPAPAVSSAPPTQIHPARDSWSAQRTLVLTTGGLGVVAAGVGTFFGLQSMAKWSDAKMQCPASCAPGSEATVARSDALHAATAADIAFGAAAVLLGGAGVLWFTAGARSPVRSAGPVRVVAFAGPTTGVLLAGSFGP